MGSASQVPEGTGAYKADDISRYVAAFCRQRGRAVSVIRLNFLLYLIQVYFICFSGRGICFEDPILAGSLGPVVIRAFLAVPEGPGELVDPEDRYIIDDVLTRFMEYSAADLFDLVRRQPPWQQARQSRDHRMTRQMLEGYFAA